MAAALLVAFLIKTFLLQAFFIPSASMVPALQVGDRILVEKVSYRLREPQRGEMVVFHRPGRQAERGAAAAARGFFEGLGLLRPGDDTDLIKRVVGLPGETVEVRNGTVVVDGHALREPWVVPDGRSFAPVTVPDGAYYVLGDNRTNSDDSRYTLGTLPREEVVGRAFAIVWPPAHASVSLRTDYAGADPPAGAGRPDSITAPPALPGPDDP